MNTPNLPNALRLALGVIAASAALIAAAKGLNIILPIRASISDLGWIAVACAAARHTLG